MWANFKINYSTFQSNVVYEKHSENCEEQD